MSRSCTPSRGRGRKVGTATIAGIAVLAALLIGGCGAQKNASLTSTSSHGATATASYTAVANVTPPVAATDCAAPSTAKYALTCQVPASQPGSQSSTITSSPTNPAPHATTPGNTPTGQPGSPTDSASQPATETTAPGSAPTTARSVPTSDSGGTGATPMSIPAQDTLSDTIELGYTVSNGTEVDGGVAPYTWSITGLPPGVTQMQMGYGSTAVAAITGTATATGTYPLTVTVTDSEVPAQTLVVHFTFVVLQPSSEVWGIITPGLLTGTVGAPYSADFTATNGVNATFSVSSGELPPGISLSSTGVLSGTPTERGTFFVGIIGTNVATGGVKDAGNFNFTVNPD